MRKITFLLIALCILAVGSTNAFAGPGHGSGGTPTTGGGTTTTTVTYDHPYGSYSGYDYGDAAGYAKAWNECFAWQRLGKGWSAETSQKATDTYDDGVSWSTDGGVTYGKGAITAGTSVIFKFDIYKYQWGTHTSDVLGFWLDLNQDGDFTDSGEMVLYKEFALTTKSDALTSASSATGEEYHFTYYLTYTVSEDLEGTLTMRARVTCDESIKNAGGFSPNGYLWQGETEDDVATVNPPVKTPEPASLLLLGLGLVGLAGIGRKMKK